MSFGAAAAADDRAGFPRLRDAEACPCGSGTTLGGCCAPVIASGDAPTAERLMRSRYTAFVIGDASHLRATWHPGTAPVELELDPRRRWRGLEIVAAEEGDRRGLVEFRARWRHGNEGGVLHERSRFVRQSGRWWYLDGDVR